MANQQTDFEYGAAFQIGDVQAEPGLNRLTSAGGVVTVEPRVMELLVQLARQAGETVSKERLLAEVWSGAFVVDSVVAKTVSALRQALGDDAGAPRYILTVPRRGYRLIAPVTWGEFALGAQASAQPAPMPLSKGLRPGDGRTVRAVRGALFALVALGLVVAWAPWRRSGISGDTAVERPQEALPLDLDRQLLEAQRLWSHRGFDELREAHELFRRIAAAPPDSGPIHAWLALSLVTRSTYSQGGRRATMLEAEAEVGRALALAPDDPVTLTALGVVALNQHFDLDRAIAAYRQAIARAPGFAPAHQFLAEALSATGRHAEARQEIQRAIALEPTSALFHGVAALVAMGANDPQEALAASERALALESRFWWLYRYRGQAWLRLGNESQAAEAFISEWSGPAASPNHRALQEIAERSGLTGLWQHRLETLLERRRDGAHVLTVQLAESYAAVGRFAEALNELEGTGVADEAEYFLYARTSPVFDPLRDNPRFRAAYARFGL